MLLFQRPVSHTQPASVQEKYKFLCYVYEKCLEKISPGMQLKAVHEEACRIIKERMPDLLPLLPKELGFCTGLVCTEGLIML
jgi:nucleosome binding factor SPN SPT16 subunit